MKTKTTILLIFILFIFVLLWQAGKKIDNLNSRLNVLQEQHDVLQKHHAELKIGHENFKKYTEYEIVDTWRFRARTRKNFMSLRYRGIEDEQEKEIEKKPTAVGGN